MSGAAWPKDKLRAMRELEKTKPLTPNANEPLFKLSEETPQAESSSFNIIWVLLALFVGLALGYLYAPGA